MNEMTRREMLTQALPAAAVIGAGLAATGAFAQGGGQQQQGGIVARMLAQSFQNGEYKLPELPYGYDALEPAIDEATLRLHHDKHHQAYVNGLNTALKNLAGLGQGGGDTARLYGLQRDLSFNAGGHILHSLFWATMAPNAGGQPQGALAEAINRDFGSFDQFKTYFSGVATTVKGSGWAVLSYEPLGDRLVVYMVEAHDIHLAPTSVALLPLDAWEHAYYLKYQNQRAEFVKAWWAVVNWPAVGEFYDLVRAKAKAGGTQLPS